MLIDSIIPLILVSFRDGRKIFSVNHLKLVRISDRLVRIFRSNRRNYRSLRFFRLNSSNLGDGDNRRIGRYKVSDFTFFNTKSNQHIGQVCSPSSLVKLKGILAIVEVYDTSTLGIKATLNIHLDLCILWNIVSSHRDFSKVTSRLVHSVGSIDKIHVSKVLVSDSDQGVIFLGHIFS